MNIGHDLEGQECLEMSSKLIKNSKLAQSDIDAFRYQTKKRRTQNIPHIRMFIVIA